MNTAPAAAARHADPRVARVVAMFEAMAPRDVARLHQFYADDAAFKDPFNEVRGLLPIKRVFAHMFVKLDAPRFVVHAAVAQGDECFLTWDFCFFRRGRKARPYTIHGGTHLRFAPDGRIALQRDYWDAAEELYEKLPLLGPALRWLRRRLAVPMPAAAPALPSAASPFFGSR